jgi:hypothetical protein
MRPTIPASEKIATGFEGLDQDFREFLALF